MEKVNEMKSQRKTLEEKLRKEIHADDVTAALVTREGSTQEVSKTTVSWMLTIIIS